MTGAPHLLLVEDDASLRRMYELIFTKAGFTVTTADDGVAGLTRAREGGYDLILLDLMMPNLDGVGVLKGLQREKPRRSNGPIIVLTNVGYGEVAEEATGLGAAGFLVKSDWLPRDLVNEVKKHLKK